MAGDRNIIRQTRDDLAHHREQFAAAFIGNGAAGGKHRKFVAVDDLDAQAFGRAVDDDLVGEVLHSGLPIDRLLQGVFGLA